MTTVKTKEEKKFAQISPDTVFHLAESIGISNVGPSVARSLSEDASYRCRELANICGQFLRHGKRRKLTTQDVERAMRWSNADPVYGHGAGSNEPGYSRIADPTRNGNHIFVLDEKMIDLRPYALMHSPAILASKSTISGTWVALEGTLVPENEESKSVDYPPQGALTQHHLQYYSTVINIVLGNSESLMQKLLDDISTNPKLNVLVPTLISFIRNGMQKHCDNQILIRRLLWLLQAVFTNPTLNLSPKPYLSHLVTALLSSLIVDRPGRDRNDFDCLSYNVDHIQQASQILRQVLNRWATPVNQLRSQTHKALREYLKDTKISFSSHFGAITAIIALGPKVLEECLLPQMQVYLQNLEDKGMNVNRIASLHRIEIEKRKKVLGMVRDTFLIGTRALLQYYVQNTDCAPTNIKDIYEMFYKIFGDSVSCTPLPKVHVTVQPAHKPSAPAAGRVCIRKLRPLTKKSTIVKSEPNVKMEMGEVIDFYSNSSRQDFNLYADFEMPNDIFEPEQSNQNQHRPDPILSDQPETLSTEIHKWFDQQRRKTTVVRNPFIFIVTRQGQCRPPNLLRRKLVAAPRVGQGFKSNGVIGKRLGHVTELSERKTFLINSHVLNNVL